MKKILTPNKITLNEIFQMMPDQEIEFSKEVCLQVEHSEKNFHRFLTKNIPIYGVTTGFGDSCHRSVQREDAEILQDNLISYLLMGTGKNLSKEVSSSILLFRIISLSRGLSGISLELLNKMKELYNKKIFPIIPREGSLGASGDLIPLAYLAHLVRGQGRVFYQNTEYEMEEIVAKGIYLPYTFKPKEGLAIVNGTSAMLGLCFHNLKLAKFLTELAILSSSWLCLTIQGRTEAFGSLVNEKAKSFVGQKIVAKKIWQLLEAENYKVISYKEIAQKNHHTTHLVQDPYSLRCTPQVIGPICDTLELLESWLEIELNSVSDNPLFDGQEEIANGGNFYGGHLAHSMDYLKICLANLADLMDRQLTLLISEKTNRGLTPNLADWEGLPASKRHLSHGLKAVHQNVSAITSDIMSKAIPNSIFSRSSESHNQDKISLGMTAAVQCSEQLDLMVSLVSCYLCCLSQAIDLRKINLQHTLSQKIYQVVRQNISFVKRDQRLDLGIESLRQHLLSLSKEPFFI